MQKNNYKTFNDYFNDKSIEKGGKYLNKIQKLNNDLPLISIVTVCRNSERTLQKTFDAVRAQTYANIEYILIDGNSDDATLRIIKDNEDILDFWLSEPDLSATDAINKAFNLIAGDYAFLLNADDYIKEDFLEIAFQAFQNYPNYDFIYGDLWIGTYEEGFIKLLKGDKNYEKRILYTMPTINQPTLVFKKYCLDKIGFYDIKKEVAPDYDWLVRGFCKGLRGKYIDGLEAYFSIGGNSDIHGLKGFIEVRNSSFQHGGSIFWTNYYFLRKSIPCLIRKLLK